MFSKGSKPSSSVAPVTVSHNEKRGPSVPSIISADLKIVGDMTSSGDIQIDGTVEGNITSRGLTIGEGAKVQGALVAESVQVYGAVTGTISANSVVLAKSAKIDGDISHQSLSMEAGASLAGQISRLAKPIGGQAAAGSAPAATGKPTATGAATYKPYTA
jgi:cytoskeletal protein CcmA (bactofilin family)